MKLLSAIALSAAAVVAAPLSAHAAADAQQLMSQNGCSACHAAKQKVIGPAWGWVAYHFQGQKDAVDTVADFIINGGVGYWKPWTGEIPMPSHPNLTKDEARTIAKWVLSQTPIQPPKP